MIRIHESHIFVLRKIHAPVYTAMIFICLKKLDGCVVNVVVTRFIKCCCTFLKLTRGYTGVDMVSGRYILIAPAMGKLQNFLLIILCGNDRNSGFYDKSNAFIFFYLNEEFIEATNSFSCIFYFVLVKIFFLHVLAACRRALKTKPLFRFLKEVTNLWSKKVFLLHQSNSETTANQRAHSVVPMKAYEIKHL